MSIGIAELILVLAGLALAVAPIVGGVLGIVAFLKVNRIEQVLRDKELL